MSANPAFQNGDGVEMMSSSGSSSNSMNTYNAKTQDGLFSKRNIIIALIVLAAIVIIVVAVVLGVVLSQPTSHPVPRSGANELLVAELGVRQDGVTPRVVARSYGGQVWEQVSDLDYPPVGITCNSNNDCSMDTAPTNIRSMPVPDSLVSSTTTRAAGDKERAARLLLQGTFGPTRAELNSVSTTYAGNFVQWVRDQIALSPSLLRRYYRERANPRASASTGGVGSMRRLCSIGSRYHKYALNLDDEGARLVVAVSGSVYTLTINGILRGEVSNFLGNVGGASVNITFPATFAICDVVEGEGETVLLSNSTGNPGLWCKNNTNGLTDHQFPNPAIAFSSPPATTVQSVGANELSWTDVPGRPGDVILKTFTITCQNRSVGGEGFLGHSGAFYKFDGRLKLLENSLENPGNFVAEEDVQCPAVPKTFLNKAQCVRRASCSPLTFNAARITLNETNLRSWYTTSERFTYYIRGLRLEEPYNTSVCAPGTVRFLIKAGACAADTSLDATTSTTLANLIRSSADANPLVRDVVVTGVNCTITSPVLVNITVDGNCYEHVHPHYYDVRDASYWTLVHDGNAAAMSKNLPNPIARWAQQGLAYIDFPSHHLMSRWSDRQSRLPVMGRFRDEVEFRSLRTELQTRKMADIAGAVSSRSNKGFEACGDPGEVGNKPELGHRYQVADPRSGTIRQHQLDFRHNLNAGKQMIWMNNALKAPDQLRQRMAWALSQIFTMSTEGLGRSDENEPWARYYDIFVRNAFGNYRDLMKEVSYSPMMSFYLSYRANLAFASAGTYPDENYAREIMQLFSIGLWKLNDDGTRVLDSTGNPVATYTNEDIVDYARVWTGFDTAQPRGNLEAEAGLNSRNVQDVSQIKPVWRDFCPKSKLGNEGYLGDHYPLCTDLPAAHWTKKGARFVLTGESSAEGTTVDGFTREVYPMRGRFRPSNTTSALYAALCAKSGDGKCTFPTEVVLSADIPCDGPMECQGGRVKTVKIVDYLGNTTQYYSYVPVPCVKLTFFNGGKFGRYGGDFIQCLNPNEAFGTPGCCRADNLDSPIQNYTTGCLFINEATTYAVAKQRCEAVAGQSLCDITYRSSSLWSRSCIQNGFQWLEADCSPKLQVLASGRIGAVDLNVTLSTSKSTMKSSGNVFRGGWINNQFPVASGGSCGVSCSVETTVSGDTCLCDYLVTDSAVYTDLDNVPKDANAVRTALSIGSPPPDASYTKCVNSTCMDLSNNFNISVWNPTANGEQFSMLTIFEIPPFRVGGAQVYLRNRLSMVSIPGTSFAFRNPVGFLPFLGSQTHWRDWQTDEMIIPEAENEVDALIDHLFYHDSTAPFVAYRLIQRLVTSNPSYRYMRSVVNAFRTGTYAGVTYSGKYGDLEATIYAILLDQEARSPLVEADPAYGSLREPLLKLMHLLRTLEFKTRSTMEISLPDISLKIGQEAFRAPSVFGFYLTEHRPAGGISDNGLASPEAELGTTPKIIAFMNGIASLVNDGLSSCNRGFGWGYIKGGRSCGNADNRNRTADGTFQFVPTPGTPLEIVNELDLLLTAGRMNATTKEILAGVYSDFLAQFNADLAFKAALKLMIYAPEFHATGANLIGNTTRAGIASVPSQGRPYKAIVIFFEAGGCDSFSRIVPHSDCTKGDYYAEYADVRQGAAVPKPDLLTINVPAGSQPCNVFGVNPDLVLFKNLYDAGELAFVAGIGGLVEPVTKADYQKTSGVVKRFPPSLFAHNIMQRSLHNLHAQLASAKGVLGRAIQSLLTQPSPYRSELYSLVGNIKMLEGTKPPSQIDRNNGVLRFEEYDALKGYLANLTKFKSSSRFAENWASVLENSLNQTESIGALLEAVSLTATFQTDVVSRQLEQVSKIIKLRTQLGTERDVFVINRGGFDTHGTHDLSDMFQDTNTGFTSFVAEMRAQNVWNDVVVMSVSDFGRTITSNGQGTDHAWSGNHFVMGGGVKGGKILGKYPTGLRESDSLNIGRGRIIPQYAWEHPWNGILEWFGVAPANMDICLPNRQNFPDLFTMAEMFN